MNKRPLDDEEENSMTSRVTLTLANSVAEVVLTSSERANALDLGAAIELRDALERVAAQENTLRVLVIRAEGEHFCVGGDLRSFAAEGDRMSDYVFEVTEPLHAALRILHRLSIPVVTAAQGAIAGAGVGLVLASDIVLLAKTAKLRLAYAAIGLSPDNGASYLLPRSLGRGRALGLLLTNRAVAASEALAWGLAIDVVPSAELRDATRTLVDELVAGSGEAQRVTKQLVRASEHKSLDQHLDAEAASITLLVDRDFAKAAISRFVDR